MANNENKTWCDTLKQLRRIQKRLGLKTVFLTANILYNLTSQFPIERHFNILNGHIGMHSLCCILYKSWLSLKRPIKHNTLSVLTATADNDFVNTYGLVTRLKRARFYSHSGTTSSLMEIFPKTGINYGSLSLSELCTCSCKAEGEDFDKAPFFSSSSNVTSHITCQPVSRLWTQRLLVISHVTDNINQLAVNSPFICFVSCG